MNASQGRLRSERGAVAVEFALVVPLLLILLFSIVSVSRAFQVQATLSGAAREAARTMAIENNVAAAKAAAVFAASTSKVPLSNTQITVAVDGGGTCTGKPTKTNIVVIIKFPFQPVGDFAAGKSFTIESKAVLRCGG